MAGTIGQFDFELTGMGPFPEGSIAIPNPTIHICLTHKGHETSGGFSCLMLNFTGPEEIDAHILLLKADLDAVGARAMRAIIKARAEAKAHVAKRIIARGSD